MVGEPYRVDRRRTSHEAYGGALQAGVQTKTVYQHLVYAGRDKARAGDEQQIRRRLHILILAQGADSLLAQFYALRFEPLHPLGAAGKCAEPVETLAVGGLEINIVDRFPERPALLVPGQTRHAARPQERSVGNERGRP